MRHRSRHDLVVDLWRARQPSILLVTHDVDEALLLADRALVIDGGRIAAEVRIEAGRPRDPTAARFVMQRRELLALLGVQTHAPEQTASYEKPLPLEIS